MKVKFTPISDGLLPECRAFNQRLSRHGAPPFSLPETVPAQSEASESGIDWSHYAAVDETGAVRGGVLLMEQRGWLRQQPITLINIQSPLSEGTIDRAFAGVGLQMLKFVMGRTPFLYAVGMGGEENPFARLLKAVGWRVALVPFQFSVVRARRFLCEVEPLRKGNRKWLARAAAVSGLGSAALAAWQVGHRRSSSHSYALESAALWPDTVDEVWERCCQEMNFSVLRDRRTLSGLYPDSQPRLKRFLLRSGGRVVGWSAGLVTPMNADRNFGNLVVATLLDGLAPAEHLPVLLERTTGALRDLGADLIISNQTHINWRAGLKRVGYFSGPSNYLLAVSKPVAAALEAAGGQERIHVNRGDGDGRIHL
jgi:hypothetical protein